MKTSGKLRPNFNQNWLAEVKQKTEFKLEITKKWTGEIECGKTSASESTQFCSPRNGASPLNERDRGLIQQLTIV